MFLAAKFRIQSKEFTSSGFKYFLNMLSALIYDIYVNSGYGVIFDGSVRDIEGLERIGGFNAYIRGWVHLILKI